MSAPDDELYMRRALQLAANGRGYTSPNPMVGAVVVARRRIIGEGWHRQFGGPHAEVNAMNSIAEADRPLVGEATIYVTLEPCSHYGKTPPCAAMLVERGVRRVVVGSGDPNPKVSGRGIAMLRQAGIEVDTGVLEKECEALNEAFMTAHRRHRPFVTLKWAQSADGYIDGRFSRPDGRQLVHWRRAQADAIVVGAGTVLADNPSLTVRDIEGRSPRPVVLDRRGLLVGSDLPLMRREDTIHITSGESLRSVLERLYGEFGYISVLVEGGAGVLGAFIAEGLWDRAYVECSPDEIRGNVKAPTLPCQPAAAHPLPPNTVYEYRNPNL